MTRDKAAAALGISRATAARQWAHAKTWLLQHLMAMPPTNDRTPVRRAVQKWR
jgi:hypothetical protein